jgi:class 3 adenylate cyclase/pimeloyl-ACP methyl ester carboxylesterase
MAEPQIQYCRTSDSVSIGFTQQGAGAPLVVVPGNWSNVGVFNSVGLPLLEPLMASGMEVILIDGRGIGASRAAVADVSLPARVRDVEAVIDHLALPPLTLLGMAHGSPTAIAYAANHPENVNVLMLLNAYANASEYFTATPVQRAMFAMDEAVFEEWDFYTSMAASATFRFRAPEAARRLADVYRESKTPEMHMAYRKAFLSTDVTEMLSDIRCPTLVLDDKASVFRVEEQTRSLARAVPGARMLTFDSRQPDSADSIIAALPEHVPSMAAASAAAAPAPIAVSGTAVILFADVVDSTAITARIGNEAFRKRTRQLDDALRAVIRGAGGSPVEGRTLGDGVLGVFTSAAQAIGAALQCGQHAERVGLQLHLGIHAGDVLRESGGGVSGIAVSMASRISDLTDPNEILVSATVRDLARAATDVAFDDRGEHALKGVAEPQRLFAVRQLA